MVHDLCQCISISPLYYLLYFDKLPLLPFQVNLKQKKNRVIPALPTALMLCSNSIQDQNQVANESFCHFVDAAVIKEVEKTYNGRHLIKKESEK